MNKFTFVAQEKPFEPSLDRKEKQEIILQYLYDAAKKAVDDWKMEKMISTAGMLEMWVTMQNLSNAVNAARFAVRSEKLTKEQELEELKVRS